MWERMKGWGRTVIGKAQELTLAAAVGVSLAIAEASPAFAQSASIFPVSPDVATIKADLLLWMTAFIGVTLAIYGYLKIRRVAH